jgi:hypothetical protein
MRPGGGREAACRYNDQTEMRSVDPHLTSPLQGEDIERFSLLTSILNRTLIRGDDLLSSGASKLSRQEQADGDLTQDLREDFQRGRIHGQQGA